LEPPPYETPKKKRKDLGKSTGGKRKEKAGLWKVGEEEMKRRQIKRKKGERKGGEKPLPKRTQSEKKAAK